MRCIISTARREAFAKAVTDGKGIIAEGSRGVRLAWFGKEHLSDCRIAECYRIRPHWAAMDSRCSHRLFFIYTQRSKYYEDSLKPEEVLENVIT